MHSCRILSGSPGGPAHEIDCPYQCILDWPFSSRIFPQKLSTNSLSGIGHAILSEPSWKASHSFLGTNATEPGVGAITFLLHTTDCKLAQGENFDDRFSRPGARISLTSATT